MTAADLERHGWPGRNGEDGKLMEFEGPLLVVGAHPDDTEFGAGGTVAAFTTAGQQAHYIVCTDGSKGSKERSINPRDLVQRRAAEQRGAAEELGVASVTFLE